MSFSRELNCNNCLPDNTSSLIYKIEHWIDLYRINSHIRQVFSTENHCCLSLSKCVNDKVEYKYRRLRGKSKMTTDYGFSCPLTSKDQLFSFAFDSILYNLSSNKNMQ